jgi:hypothetical protein
MTGKPMPEQITVKIYASKQPIQAPIRYPKMLATEPNQAKNNQRVYAN